MKKIFIYFLFFCILLFSVSAEKVILYQEGFTRANDNSLGENWTEYAIAGQEVYKVENNYMVFDVSNDINALHWTGNADIIANGVTDINLMFKVVSPSSSTTHNIASTNTTGEFGNTQGGFNCGISGTALTFACYNSTTSVILTTLTSNVWYNLTIANISRVSETYEVMFNYTNWGIFNFKDSGWIKYLSFYNKDSGTSGLFYLDNVTGYYFSEEEIVYNYSINVSLDKNITTNDTIFLNWTTIGNYSYSELYRNHTLIYNGTDKNFTNINLLPNTTYFFNITVYWNVTLFNDTVFNITTLENTIETVSVTSNISVNLTTIENLLKQNNEAVNMLWVIIFIGIFLLIGWLIRTYILWAFTSIGWLLIALNMGQRAIETSGEAYYHAGFYAFLVLAIMFFVIGVTLQIITVMKNKKELENNSKFYQDY